MEDKKSLFNKISSILSNIKVDITLKLDGWPGAATVGFIGATVIGVTYLKCKYSDFDPLDIQRQFIF